MAGVGEGEPAVGGDLGAEAGGEAAEAHIGHGAVEVVEEVGGGVGVALLGGAEEDGGGHGGGSAFAADVAEEDALAVAGEDAATVEVAADLARGQEGDADVEAGHGLDGAGREHALDLLGGLHFAGENGAIFDGLALFTKEQGQQGGEDADGGDGSGGQKRESPAGEEIGQPHHWSDGHFHGEPYEVGCAPEHAESSEGADAAGDFPPGPKDKERNKRDEEVADESEGPHVIGIECAHPGRLI